MVINRHIAAPKRLGAIVGVLLCTLGVILDSNSSGERAAQDDASYEILYGEKRDIAKNLGPGLTQPSAAAMVQSPAGFDVLHYVIDVTIDPIAMTVDGTVDVTFMVTSAVLDSFLLYLNDNMMVTHVEMTEIPLGFAHTASRIVVDLAGAYALGETLTVSVSYNGAPVQQGLRFHPKVVYNLSEPDMARNWFPCYDEPWDKATSEMVCTIPDHLFCASNGLLVSETDNLDGTKTFHWDTKYPHSTYLTSVAISDYITFSHWYHYAGPDSLEMPYYVYPEKLAQAHVSFAQAPAMMEFFSETYGPYPFIEEVYATALAEVGGAMENFTCTTYGQVLVTGDNRYDWVVAHELAHSWFGNCVTMADWREIWLNEGFATYSDAMWREHLGGQSALDGRMDRFKDEYFNEDASSRFPLYDPVNMWGATVYEKGAWVLHMLRYVVGDTAFFDAARMYYQTFSFATATTEDLRAVFESVSGADLFGFFDEWVYQAGYPEYQYSWTFFDTGGSYTLRLTVAQVQTNAPVFTIPIEILVSFTSGDTIVALPIHGASEIYELTFSDEPMDLVFDPGNHILKTVVEVPTGIAATDVVPGLTVKTFPNPATQGLTMSFYLPRGGDVVIDVFDVTGRRAGRLQRSELPARWNTIQIGRHTEGVRLDRSGVYFYRLTYGDHVATGKFTLVR